LRGSCWYQQLGDILRQADKRKQDQEGESSGFHYCLR
jgi:hypothetical protein